MQKERGGWRRRDGGLPDIEASAWVLAALAAGGGHRDAIQRGAHWLLDQQNGDGSWGAHPGMVGDIRTAVAIIGLAAADVEVPATAVDWLLKARILPVEVQPTGGWGWNPASWNFIEPTSLALLALAAVDRIEGIDVGHMRLHYIAAQGAGGGWGAAEGRSLGYMQAAKPTVTGWALLANRALGVPLRTIYLRMAVVYLRRFAADNVSLLVEIPYTAAMILRGLVAYDEAPDVQESLRAVLAGGQGDNGLWKDDVLWTAQAILALTA